ncbi:hypothetical protein NQ314_019634 [Rhamnusium bicolor]|uniref:Secreted protein n=1 Tax=Rhamnusium bicolor TaxID=1586634 RepID=A0AAV8WNZ9_9CUCU|nr:hypothetical protein NQ314_019634 [Rhamnusium bicolor]
MYVFYIYIILGIQDLLCIWLHVASLHYINDSNGVCHNCVHILPFECRGLSLAMDIIPSCRFYVCLRIHLRHILFLLQDKVSRTILHM